jgi:hypothetical protein
LPPSDFDDRFFQYAPDDQQAPAFLRGGEAVLLRGLAPQHELRTVLPRLFLRLETRFYTGERVVHEPPALHAVILEPDFPRLSLVWHSALPCHFKVHKLDTTTIRVKQVVKLGETPTELADDLEPE